MGEDAGYIGVNLPYKELFGGAVGPNATSLQLLHHYLDSHKERAADGATGPHSAAVEAGRGGRARGRGGRKDSDKIDSLEKSMAKTLRVINSKLSKLDDQPAAAAAPTARAPRVAASATLPLTAAALALTAALALRWR